MLLRTYWRYLVWDTITFATALAVIKGAEFISPCVGAFPAAIMATPVILVAVYFILLARTGNLKKNRQAVKP